MSILKEFREFAVKGNVVDLAVGVIIGAAFGKIVTSLVSDVIMPPIGLALGGVNFTALQLVLKDALPGGTPVALKYGNFLQAIIDFAIIAAAVFGIVKLINRMKREEITAPPVNKQEQLLTEIRDALRDRPDPKV